MSDMFGETAFRQLDIDPETGEGIMSKTDLAEYRNFLELLEKQGKGVEAKVVVVTGEIITKGKASRGRGKKELSDARAFQQAASEMGHGLRIVWRHGTDGKTTLRLMLKKKREFSEETQRKRNAALDKRRLSNAKAKLALDPKNPELQEKVKIIEARLNGTSPAAKSEAPATKSTAAKS
jgi:hypothetical protein